MPFEQVLVYLCICLNPKSYTSKTIDHEVLGGGSRAGTGVYVCVSAVTCSCTYTCTQIRIHTQTRVPSVKSANTTPHTSHNHATHITRSRTHHEYLPSTAEQSTSPTHMVNTQTHTCTQTHTTYTSPVSALNGRAVHQRNPRSVHK